MSRGLGPPEQIGDDLDELVHASIAVFGILADSLAPTLHQVTLQQYRVLVLAKTHGPLRSGDLADQLGIRASGLTRIVDRLIRDGFAEKIVSELSRREVIVTVTPRGAELVEGALQRRRQVLEGVLAQLSSSDRAAVRQAARAVADIVENG